MDETRDLRDLWTEAPPDDLTVRRPPEGSIALVTYDPVSRATGCLVIRLADLPPRLRKLQIEGIYEVRLTRAAAMAGIDNWWELDEKRHDELVAGLVAEHKAAAR